MRQILSVFLLLCIILLSACGIMPTEESSSAPTQTEFTEPWMPTYRTEVEKQMLPEIEEGHFIEILGAKNQIIIFAEQEEIVMAEEMYSTYYTHQIGLYDAKNAQVLSLWIPETEGYYFAGAISDTQGTVCVCKHDYINAYPSQYIVSSFDTEEKLISELNGEIHWLFSLENGNIIYSYTQTNGLFGVDLVENGQASNLYSWQTDEQTEPLGGLLSVYENQFSFTCVENGEATLLVADSEKILQRYSLEFEKERLDSCCITPLGLVACLSVGEGTADVHRSLRLLSEYDEPISIERNFIEGALYQMRFAQTMGVAVDHQWGIHVLGVSKGNLGSEKMNEPLLDDYKKQPVRFFVADDFSFYFFYPESQALFYVTIGPSA